MENSVVFDELCQSLENFGLDSTDVKVYLNLLQHGKETIGNIAKNTCEDRGKIYRTVDKLRSMEIITTSLTNPTICYPNAPKDALLNLRNRKEEEILQLKKLESKVVEGLHLFAKMEKKGQVESYLIIQGRLNIFSKIGKVIEQTEDSVYIVTNTKDLLSMYYTSIPEKITLSAKKGKTIRIIIDEVDGRTLDFLKKFSGCEIKKGKLPSHGRIVVGKGSDLLMSSGVTKDHQYLSENDAAFFTDSNGMVSNIYRLCEFLWRTSQAV